MQRRSWRNTLAPFRRASPASPVRTMRWLRLRSSSTSAFMKVPDANGGYTIDHTGNIVIIDPKGRYAGFIKLPHDADQISDGISVDRAKFLTRDRRSASSVRPDRRNAPKCCSTIR